METTIKDENGKVIHSAEVSVTTPPDFEPTPGKTYEFIGQVTTLPADPVVETASETKLVWGKERIISEAEARKAGLIPFPQREDNWLTRFDKLIGLPTVVRIVIHHESESVAPPQSDLAEPPRSLELLLFCVAPKKTRDDAVICFLEDYAKAFARYGKWGALTWAISDIWRTGGSTIGTKIFNIVKWAGGLFGLNEVIQRFISR